MHDVHTLVQLFGRKEGLQKASEQGVEPRLLRVLEQFYKRSDTVEFGAQFSGWSLLHLPHKELPSKDAKWQRDLSTSQFACSLLVEPGELMMGGKPVMLGVPYGSTARVMLLYLQTEAIKHRSREIELGSSMYEWMKRLGLNMGGRDYQRVRDQMMRIFACNLRFIYEGFDADGRSISAFKKDSIVESGAFYLTRKPVDGQRCLWNDRVVLSDGFHKALCEHPVPINLGAIRSILRSSLALDVYVWLAYRLHVLEQPRHVTWQALMSQFGPGYKRLVKFRERFADALSLAMCVYPGARVDVDESGVVLRPSPPAVPERRVFQVINGRAGGKTTPARSAPKAVEGDS